MLDIEIILKEKGKTPYRGRDLTKEEKEKGVEPYRPLPKLKYAVNLTILLEKRPLLLKGEPGSGKTRLAEAVANELGLDFYFWDIKSTTRAKDGLYRYDSVKRLQDAQLAGSGDEQTRNDAIKRLNKSQEFSEYCKDDESVQETGNPYLQYGPLGKAFTSEKQAVVLIDEIDKADIDFPNDLLRELDKKILRIEEIGQERTAKIPPLIFITSNDEKDLPDAFLRRCLFHYIDFPSLTHLQDIVKLYYPTSGDNGEKLISAAVERFCQLRNDMGKDKGKKVSTAELLDWYTVLVCDPNPEQVIKELDPNNKKIPYPEILLKRLEDWRLLD
ncbi:MAG: AAA family ATPase [Crocosphaera sp.]